MDGQTVEDLVKTFGEGMGPGFTAVSQDGFAAVIHPEYGLAAIVPSEDEERAAAAAASLTASAAKAGASCSAMHFAIAAPGGGKPPWVLEQGPGMTAAAVAAMIRGSASRPPLGEKAALDVATYLYTGKVPRKPLRALSQNFLRLAQACVEKAVNEESVWVAGVSIDARDVVAPNFMLPAVLVHAAQEWAIPVVSKKGQGGFTIGLAPDPSAILGYRVTGLEVSSPVLLFLPMANLMRRSFVNGECHLDESVRRFHDFLVMNGLDSDAVGDVDVKVVASS